LVTHGPVAAMNRLLRRARKTQSADLKASWS